MCRFVAIAGAALLSAICGSPAYAEGCRGEPVKAWTVLVFMAADKSLEPFAEADVLEMQHIGSSPDLNLAVQIETAAAVKRFYVRQGERERCPSPTSTAETMTQDVKSFLSWGFKTLPGSHHAVILWGHSRGIASTLQSPPEDVKAAGAGVKSTNEVWLPQIPDMALALAESIGSAKLDLLGFDSCFIGSIESAYQFRNIAKVMVASEGSIAKAGWDYAAVLLPLERRSHGALSAEEFARHIAAQANGLAPPADVAALRLEQVQRLATAAKALFRSLRRSISEHADDRRALSILLRHVNSVRVRQFLDLEHLCLTIRDEFDGNVRRDAMDVLGVLHEFVIARGGAAASATALGGLSIYYPHVVAPARAPGETKGRAILDGSADPREYASLDFVRESGWQQLLDLLGPQREIH
jgi:hypothetical protein